MQTPTILVVVDEELIRWSLTTRLKEDGYRLPDADGLTVLKQIKEADPDTLVLGVNRDQIRYRIEKFQLAKPS